MVALSITKLRVGAEAYQLSGVAQTLDDYYTGHGEAAGQWVGGSAPVLGLTGDVNPDDLRAVLAGIAPHTGGQSPNGGPPTTHARRVPGFDLTFKAPKSVSVLYAVTDDPRIQGAIIDAGTNALNHAIGWLEREAVRVRRGSNNQPWIDAQRALGNHDAGIRELPTTGLVAASFRHRTSRAGDPFLHWHVLAANMTQGVDGKWSAFVHPELYRHAKTAGEIFQTVMREELTRTIGVEWRPGKHVTEIAGIPDPVLRQFSKRRSEIEAWTTATGTPADPVGNQAAALATRRSKSEQETTVGLNQRWQTEAAGIGWGPEQAQHLLATSRPRTPADYVDGVWRLADVGFDENGAAFPIERAVTPAQWGQDVLRRDLTDNSTTFTRLEATHAVAARLGDGATVETIERVTNHLFASPDVVAVGDGTFTSQEIKTIEQRFLSALERNAVTTGVPDSVVAGVVGGVPSLGLEQATAVRALTSAPSAVSVLIGQAGTGKTFTLDAVRATFENGGFRIVGAAPSARAAKELQEGAGIESSTMHALLGQLDKGLTVLDPETVLVIDEAGMADIRTLERLVSLAVREGSRVVLVGDHRQLPEVGAGGGFAYASGSARTVCELGVNRRQKEPWEQRALTDLRDGNVPDAVQAYVDNRRVIVAPDGESMFSTAVDAWFAAQDRGLDLVLQAGTNDVADRLNAAVVGRLSGPGGPLAGAVRGEFGGVVVGAGERVVVRRNYTDLRDRRTRVVNGNVGTVTGVAAGRVSLQIDGKDRPDVLGHSFLDAGGRLSHGYALTTHRTQGGTWDASIAVGLDGLYREGAYTALSRGREQNVLIMTDPDMARLTQEADRDLQRHDRGLPLPDESAPVPIEELLNRMSQRRGKTLAHTADPEVSVVDRLALTIPYPELMQRAAIARTHERIAVERVGEPLERLEARVERFVHTARHVGAGATVKATDRNNIGTVTRVDDKAGAAMVRFKSVNGVAARVEFGWDQLQVMKPGTARPLPDTAQSLVDQRLSGLADARALWIDTVASLGSHPGDVDRFERAMGVAVDTAASALSASRPDWLGDRLGKRPVDPTGATTWDGVVASVARFRLEHTVPDSEPLLGSRPAVGVEVWDRLTEQIGASREWLAERPEPKLELTAPDREALLSRRSEVDQILAAAPSDQRSTIAELLAGQQSLEGDVTPLQDALNTQGDRSAWIVENWPHVVESTEIDNALEAHEATLPLDVPSPIELDF